MDSLRVVGSMMEARDLIHHLRSKINPKFATQYGTISYERQQCVDVLESVIQDAERYRWLAHYLPSTDVRHDQAIVDAGSKHELDGVIDGVRTMG
jgi:hypothetical protein